MRKCIRCNTRMLENYSLQISNLTAMGRILLVKGTSILGNELGKVKVAVCPNCGEISIYFDDVDKLK